MRGSQCKPNQAQDVGKSGSRRATPTRQDPPRQQTLVGPQLPTAFIGQIEKLEAGLGWAGQAIFSGGRLQKPAEPPLATEGQVNSIVDRCAELTINQRANAPTCFALALIDRNLATASAERDGRRHAGKPGANDVHLRHQELG